MKNFSLGSLAGRIDLNLYPMITTVEISIVKNLPGSKKQLCAGLLLNGSKEMIVFSVL